MNIGLFLVCFYLIVNVVVFANAIIKPDQFGSEVSFSNDGLVALVGAHGKDESGLSDAGAAYIYTRPSTSSSTWTQQQKLLAGDGTDLEYDAQFGNSVSLSNDGLSVLVGAHYKDESGLSYAGAAYIFSRSSTSSSTWTQQHKLLAGDGTDLEAGARFGSSVSLSGNGLVALVGAHYKDEGGLSNAGAAYIFSRPSTSSSAWTQQQKLTAGDGTDLQSFANFGSSVSLSGDGLVALVGALGSVFGTFPGAAYIFSRPSTSSSTWTQQQKLTAGDGTDLKYRAWFGYSVSLSGDGLVVLVGAFEKVEDGKEDAGAAYIYTRPSTSSSTWTQQQKLLAGDGTDLEADAQFGYSVSLSGNGLVALVGADGKNEGGLDRAGAAYIFNRPSTSSSTWTQQQKLTAGDGTDLEAGAWFGNSASLSGDGLVALVGASYSDGGSGRAYIFSDNYITTLSTTSITTLVITQSPTQTPTVSPTTSPTPSPTKAPTEAPTKSPTAAPTKLGETASPTPKETKSPTNAPSPPTNAPSPPTNAPSPPTNLPVPVGDLNNFITQQPVPVPSVDGSAAVLNVIEFVGVGVGVVIFLLIIVCIGVSIFLIRRRGATGTKGPRRSHRRSSDASVRLHAKSASNSRRRQRTTSSHSVGRPSAESRNAARQYDMIADTAGIAPAAYDKLNPPAAAAAYDGLAPELDSAIMLPPPSTNYATLVISWKCAHCNNTNPADSVVCIECHQEKITK